MWLQIQKPLDHKILHKKCHYFAHKNIRFCSQNIYILYQINNYFIYKGYSVCDQNNLFCLQIVINLYGTWKELFIRKLNTCESGKVNNNKKCKYKLFIIMRYMIKHDETALISRYMYLYQLLNTSGLILLTLAADCMKLLLDKQ